MILRVVPPESIEVVTLSLTNIIYACVFPTAKPDPVRQCKILNNSSMPRTVALLSCLSAYDGGLDQTFALEVREQRNLHSRPLASVQSSPIPLFNMKYLKPGEKYLFIVTAVNSRGTSTPVTVSYKVPDLSFSRLTSNAYDSSKTTWISWTVFIAVILGCLSVVLICLCGTLFFLKIYAPRSKSNPAKVVFNGNGNMHNLGEKQNNKSSEGICTSNCESGTVH